MSESENTFASEPGKRPWMIVLGCFATIGVLATLISCTVLLVYLVTIITKPAAPTEITLFIGLGTGSDDSQLEAEHAVVDDFNKSQHNIHVNLEIFKYADAAKILKSRMDEGKGPDLVGPSGFMQFNSFHGQWLDLTPYISPADAAPYNPALVKMYKTDEGQVALPFAIYPSAVYYNKALFDAAGLKYPPASYGNQYEMPDGSSVAWSWDTVAKVARLLTLDNHGLNATQSGFDRQNIVQYGYSWNYETHPSYIGSYFGNGSMLTDDGRHAQIPDSWHAAWQWTYDGIWGDQPFIPNNAVSNGHPYDGNPFNSGKVGMIVQPSWYTCCISNVKSWDVAVLPSYKGKVGGRIDGDSFLIWKGTKHPKETYTFLLYVLNQGARKLLYGSESGENPPYGGMTARTDQQQFWLTSKQHEFPQVKNMALFFDGINYPDLPPAESYMPGYTDSWKRGFDFFVPLNVKSDFNLAAEEKKYIDDLNKIFDAAGN